MGHLRLGVGPPRAASPKGAPARKQRRFGVDQQVKSQHFNSTYCIMGPGNAGLERKSVKYNFKRKRRLPGFITPQKYSSKIRRKQDGMEENKTGTVHRRENTKSAELPIAATVSDLRRSA